MLEETECFCGETLAEAEFIILEHRKCIFHKDCMKQYIMTKEQENRPHIYCPSSECNEKVELIEGDIIALIGIGGT